MTDQPADDVAKAYVAVVEGTQTGQVVDTIGWQNMHELRTPRLIRARL